MAEEVAQLGEVLKPLRQEVEQHYFSKKKKRLSGQFILPIAALFSGLILGASFLIVDGIFLNELKKNGQKALTWDLLSQYFQPTTAPKVNSPSTEEKKLLDLRTESDIIEYFSLPYSRAARVFNACKFNAKNLLDVWNKFVSYLLLKKLNCLL